MCDRVSWPESTKAGIGAGGGVLGKERRAAEGKLLGESLGGDIQALEAIWCQLGWTEKRGKVDGQGNVVGDGGHELRLREVEELWAKMQFGESRVEEVKELEAWVLDRSDGA